MVTDVFSVADLAATDIGCWQVFVCIRLFEDDLKRFTDRYSGLSVQANRETTMMHNKMKDEK